MLIQFQLDFSVTITKFLRPKIIKELILNMVFELMFAGR